MDRDEQELRGRVRPLQAEARERLGAPPSPERLLAYHEGRLGTAERLEVEEGIAAFPEAGRLLLDLARFPAVEPAPEVEVPSDDEIAARWREFRAARRGVAAGRDLEHRPLAPVTPLPRRPESERPKPAQGYPRRWPVVLAAAAAALLAIGLAYFLGTRGAGPEARTNLAFAALAPAGEGEGRGSAEVELQVPPSADGVLLSLGYGSPLDSPVSLTVHDPRGRTVLRRDGLELGTGGTFLIDLPRQLLTPGVYRLEISAPGQPEPLAVYTVELTFE